MSLFYEEKRQGSVKRRVNLDFPPHLHRALEMAYLKKGSCRLLADGAEYDLAAGDLAVIFPDRVHAYRDSRDLDALIFILPLAALSPFRDALTGQRPVCPVLKPGSWETDGLPALMELALADQGAQEEAVMTGYFRAITGKALSRLTLTPAESKADNTVWDAVRLIRQDPAANLSRRDLARAVGVSESTLSHQFSRVLHLSLPRYVAQLRLEEAKRLLEETDLSVTQAAIKAGFGSLRSFNRVWRAQYGSSPRRNPQKTEGGNL